MAKVTITDVARLAGVDHTTVSHALSGKRPVAPQTRERILAAVRALNYQPNAAARSLVSGRSHTVGLSVPLDEHAHSLAENLSLPFIAHICLRLNHHGYKLLCLNAQDDNGQDLMRAVNRGDVDGLLLMEVQLVDPRVEALRGAGVPFVTIGRPRDGRGVVRVDADALGAGALVARHLFELGHRHIAFMGDPSSHGFRHRALDGFRRTHREYGLSFRPSRLLPCRRPEEVRVALAQLLAADAGVSALVVTTDLLAMAVLRVLVDHERRVPGDLSLVVLGESSLTTYTQPALTAIRLPIAEDCQQAVDLLIDMLNGGRPSSMEHILPVELVICDSTRRVGPALTSRDGSARALPDPQPVGAM
jgi:DNA-binding LacI/PurR family transcriptional regulator